MSRYSTPKPAPQRGRQVHAPSATAELRERDGDAGLVLAGFSLALTEGAMAGAKYLTANDPQATLASAPRQSNEQNTPLAVALDGSRDLTKEVAAMRVARL